MRDTYELIKLRGELAMDMIWICQSSSNNYVFCSLREVACIAKSACLRPTYFMKDHHWSNRPPTIH